MKTHAPERFNKAKLLGNFASGSDEWHGLRRNSIGGSEVGTILGLNRWESPYYLWATKTGALPQKVLNSFAVTLGNVLEPVILESLLPLKHPDWEVFTTGTYQHPKFDFMHANPDALAKVDGEWIIVEVKTGRNYWDEIPPNYIAQVMHYMNIMGVKKAVILGLVAMDWVEHWIEFDEFEASVIEQKTIEFWKLVQAKEEPTFDGSDSTYEAVRAMNPEVDGSEVEIDGIHELVLLDDAATEANNRLKEAKSKILSLMGSAKYAYTQIKGEKFTVAVRQTKPGYNPFLVIKKKGNK
jgi:putative phage-type endonuclease